MSTALLQVRMDNELKQRVDKRLKRMGLTMSAAVNMLMYQIDIQGRIPFEIVDHKENLAESVSNINAGIGLSKVYNDEDEMWKDLGV